MAQQLGARPSTDSAHCIRGQNSRRAGHQNQSAISSASLLCTAILACFGREGHPRWVCHKLRQLCMVHDTSKQHRIPKLIDCVLDCPRTVPVFYPDVVEILGQQVFRKLADVPGPIDIVNVFRCNPCLKQQPCCAHDLSWPAHQVSATPLRCNRRTCIDVCLLQEIV